MSDSYRRFTRTLSAEAVSVRFDGIVALSEVSLELAPGEILGLIGPNGAGKTTLVNFLTGFQLPTSGKMRLGHIDLTGMQPHELAKAGIARTFQNGRLYAKLTVLENVEVAAVAMGLARRTARSRARAVLAWLDLLKYENIVAVGLPHAYERLVGIARALAMEPEFLLLDEPAAGMSETEAQSIIDLIVRIPGEFKAGVLLIEHNMDVVTGVCPRIHVLNGGRTIAQGSPTQVLEYPEVVEAYLGSFTS